MRQANGLVRVLIIDDDPETTELLKILLEVDQFQVITANSGPHGIRLAGAEDPDVIVIDLLMPEMDGFAVCDAVRKFSQVPIIVLSAISKPGTLARALEHGADDYLLKPVKSSLLIAHLRRLVRRARINTQTDQLGI